MDLRGKKFILGTFNGEVETFIPERNTYVVKFNGLDVMEIDAATVINLVIQYENEGKAEEEETLVPSAPQLSLRKQNVSRPLGGTSSSGQTILMRQGSADSAASAPMSPVTNLPTISSGGFLSPQLNPHSLAAELGTLSSNQLRTSPTPALKSSWAELYAAYK